MENSNRIKKNKLNSYDDIRDDYNYIRQRNLLAYEDKKNKIYDLHPKLKEFDINIIRTYMDKALAINNDDKTLGFDKKINDLKELRAEYIKEHKIVDDYLEVKYDCNKCKDTGFVDGKKCSCFVQKEIDLFDNISHFKKYIESDNFNNLNTSYYNQNIMSVGNVRKYSDYMASAIMHMKDSIKEIEAKPYNAILVGPTGTGKTFLARCIGCELLKKNKSVLYVNVNEYLNSLKPDYDGVQLESYATSSDVLILDDIGTENSSEFTSTKLNYIIDKRLNDGKSTILTTNLVGDEFKSRYLDSMLSRISHLYTKYMLCGEDLRRVKNASL